MKIIKLFEEYERVYKGIDEIKIGSWVRTQQEDLEVIDKKDGLLVCKSFCNPDRIINLNPNEILSVENTDNGKRKQLIDLTKVGVDKFYKDAGLVESNIKKGRENIQKVKGLLYF